MDGEGEHDVGGGQGDDEHVRGHKLPPPEHQHQDDQQVEDAAHQHCTQFMLWSRSSKFQGKFQIAWDYSSKYCETKILKTYEMFHDCRQTPENENFVFAIFIFRSLITIMEHLLSRFY